jgi:uncharacterized protein (DUF927 family)
LIFDEEEGEEVYVSTQVAEVPSPQQRDFRADPHKGVYTTTVNAKGEQQEAWISSYLTVVASFRDQDSERWGQVVVFTDPDGKEHRVNLSAQKLISDPKATLGALGDEGLRVGTSRASQDALAQYILLQRPKARLRCVPQVGWQGASYVLPDRSFQPEKTEDLLLDGPPAREYFANVQGSLEEWKDTVSSLCSGNSRAEFAVSIAFAPPLLLPLNEESGGFQIYGATSLGKTTVQIVAGSVWGGGARHGYVRSWRATANGVEAMALMHNDGLLCLDELAQLGQMHAPEIAYLLANGQGKQRMTKRLQAEKPATWRLVYLSTGEITLAQHVEPTGRRPHGGQLVRLLDIPADAGVGLGVFEDIHGRENGATFSVELRQAALSCYGSPIRAFLSALVENQEELTAKASAIRKQFIDRVVRPDACGEVFRAAGRFGLIAAAGEIATELNITGWEEGTVDKAAERCFIDWLNARGTLRPSDEVAAVAQVKGFIERHASSRFERVADDRVSISNRAGFIKPNLNTGQLEYLIFAKVFTDEVCSGYDPQFVARALLNRKMLLVQKGTHLTVRRSLGDLGPQRVYAIVLPDRSAEGNGDGN